MFFDDDDFLSSLGKAEGCGTARNAASDDTDFSFLNDVITRHGVPLKRRRVKGV
jgi:hypothetical protein